MVDFQNLREQLAIPSVLDHYKLNQLRPLGSSLRQPCHIHKGDNPTSFSVDLEKNRWRCYAGCGQGDSISLGAVLEGKSYGEAAKLAASWFGLKEEQSSFSILMARSASP